MIAVAAGFAGLGVALGAFGAHGLKAALEAAGGVARWETAVLYQLVHALALLALGLWRRIDGTARGWRPLLAVGWLFCFGMVSFCGSLYALALGAPARVLWPVTPLGGLCFLAGWAVLAWCGSRRTAAMR